MKVISFLKIIINSLEVTSKLNMHYLFLSHYLKCTSKVPHLKINNSI
jgi:hypothetical protein